MAEQIPHCPACGGDHGWVYRSGGYYVGCMGCGYQTATHRLKKDAVAEWTDRKENLRIARRFRK